MERIKETNSIRASSPSTKDDVTKGTLKQSVLEHYGVGSPKRSLFSESSKILSSVGHPLKKKEISSDIKLNQNKIEESTDPGTSKDIDHHGINNNKIPVVNLQRLSETLIASKARLDKLNRQEEGEKKDKASESKDKIELLSNNFNSSFSISQETSEEDEEDELQEVGFLKSSRTTTPASVNSKNEKKENFLISDGLWKSRKPFTKRQYTYALNSILNERETQAINDSQLKEMEMELKTKPICDLDSANVLTENQLDLEKFAFKTRTVSSNHPGIQLFELSKCFQLYETPPLPSFLPENSVFQVFDKLLQHVQPKHFPEFLGMGGLEHQAKNLVKRPWLLEYLFHLLASHSNPHITYSCYKILMEVHHQFYPKMQKPRVRVWYPSLFDIVTALLNYGATFSVLHPKPSLLPFTENDVRYKHTLDNHKRGLVVTDLQSFPSGNLVKIIEITAHFVKIPNTYSDKDLINLIIICNAIALDKLMKEILIEREISICVGNALAQISSDFWETKVIELSQLLLKLSDHHHDMVVMTHLMPYSERGLQLQKLLAYSALHVLTGVELETQILTVEPAHALVFFKNYLQNKFDDFYFFSSMISFIDVCIGKEPSKSSRKTLLEFITLMKDAAGRIRDRIQCADATEVKNYMINIVSKWMFIVQSMPSSQKTLFEYVSTHYEIQQVDDVVEDEHAVETDGIPNVNSVMCEGNVNTMH